jgi:hypothetical protein
VVVHYAIASVKINDLDGDKAAKINFRMNASVSWSTKETVDKRKSVHRKEPSSLNQIRISTLNNRVEYLSNKNAWVNFTSKRFLHICI